MKGARVFQSPSKYVQKPGLIGHVPLLVKEFNPKLQKPGVLISSRSAKTGFGKKLLESLDNPAVVEYNEECTRAGIDRVSSAFSDVNVDHVICFGGGKLLDVGKLVADQMGATSVVMPSIASTDAPCTALGVLYTPSGEFDEYRFLAKSPDVVLVDTEVILDAPRRYLVAGMGDALATYYEARVVCRNPEAVSLIFPFIYRPPAMALAISMQCRDNLFKYGAGALASLESKTLSPAFEGVVEANILMSGLGAESAGLAAAHAIHNGLVELPETHAYLHGEKVAFGAIAQLFMEEDVEEAMRVIAFCKEVGLPTCFKDIGVDITDKKLDIIAGHCMGEGTTCWNMGPNLSKEWIIRGMVQADKAGST